MNNQLLFQNIKNYTIKRRLSDLEESLLGLTVTVLMMNLMKARNYNKNHQNTSFRKPLKKTLISTQSIVNFLGSEGEDKLFYRTKLSRFSS
jgi:hypothetical protein